MSDRRKFMESYENDIPIDGNTILHIRFNNSIVDDKGHKITTYGTPSYTDGRSGRKSATFDGTWYPHLEDAGFCPNVINLNNWTFEFWIYPTKSSFSMSEYICCSWYNNQWSWVMKFENYKPRMEARGTNGWGQTGSYSLSQNSWNHIAFCKNGSSLYIFTNGKGGVVESGLGAHSNVGDKRMDIGYKPDTGTYASGFKLDEIIISKVSKYTSNFTPQ